MVDQDKIRELRDGIDRIDTRIQDLLDERVTIAQKIAGEKSGDSLLPTHLPAIIRGRPPKFPLAFLRRHYVRAGLGFYSLCDRFNF